MSALQPSRASVPTAPAPTSCSRAATRPDPADWDDDDPMTIAEVIAVFGDRYPVRPATLRSEIHRGRLTASFVRGAFWITPANLKALFQCPVKPKAQGSTSERGGQTPVQARRSPTGGLSETERMSAARATALSAWGMQNRNSPNT